MRLVLLGLSLLTCFASTSTNAITTRGEPSCGVWVSEKRLPEKAWLVGYLSGAAAALRIDFIKGTDNESIFLWMDNYCRENPLEHIGDGADVLIEKLIKSKGLKR